MPMPLERLDQGRQKWDQALGTDTIGCQPGQVQRLLHLWPIVTSAGTRNLHMRNSGVIEQPNCILAGIAGSRDEFIEDGTFLEFCCLVVTRSDLLQQLLLASKTHT